MPFQLFELLFIQCLLWVAEYLNIKTSLQTFHDVFLHILRNVFT